VDTPYRLDEVVGRDRLRDVPPGARPDHADHVVGGIRDRQGQEPRRAAGCAHPVDHGRATPVGHVHVDDDDVWSRPVDPVDRRVDRVGVADDRERLDETLSAALSEEWPLGRLETILRLILEAGAYELARRPDIPPRVTMSEYVGIAHAFFSGSEPGLANGVLDHLARTLRGTEL